VPTRIPPNGTISLAPTGESHDQKYCKTVTMDWANSLQILFVDSLGGSVWSQFTPATYGKAKGCRDNPAYRPVPYFQ
jgi:hypothetical protein